MEFEITPHAIDRIRGRYMDVVNYGEVYAAMAERLSNANYRDGKVEIVIKKLPQPTKIIDPEMFLSGYACGSTVIAKCIVRNGGVYVDTVVLR